MRYLMINKLFGFYRSNRYAVYLGVCWSAGLLIGWAGGAQVTESVLMQICASLTGSVSVAGVILSRLLPFAIAFLSVRFSFFPLMLSFVLLKGYGYGFCISSICVAFSDAAWLVSLICLFSDTCSIVLLFWFLLRNFGNRFGTVYFDSALSCILLIALAIFEHSVISPFTVMLFNY